MPELVEVERYRRLAAGSVDRRIRTVEVLDPYCLRGKLDPADLDRALAGTTVSSARRHGKLLLLDTTGPTLGLRFGMTGSLVLDGRAAIDRLQHAPASLAERWTRCEIRFESGGVLALHDPRRLGRVELDPDETVLGPDAATVTLAQLRRALSARSSAGGPPLKARLQDQGRLAGVGNLLADEVLWRASLAPQRRSGSITEVELRRLHRAVRAVVRELLARGGSHLGDLAPQRHVGGRCPRDGTPLQRDQVGGRTTWWCPSHQR